MKKTLLFLTVAALLCSCAAEPAETTPPQTVPAEITTTTAETTTATTETTTTTTETTTTTTETTTTTAETTTTTAETTTTTAETTTTTAETTTTTAEPEQTTSSPDRGDSEPDRGDSEPDRGERLAVAVFPSCLEGIDPADLYFYKNDASPLYGSEDYGLFDYAYGFEASVYDDSTLHPERFDLENRAYTPETKYTVPKPFKIEAGDTVGGYRISSAYTMTSKLGGNEEMHTVDVSTIVLDGEYSFTGVLRFFYDDDYEIAAGGLRFLPAEPPENLPIPIGFRAYPSFFSGNTAVYSELAEGFYVGDLFTGETGNRTLIDEENNTYAAIKLDESVLAELNRMLSGETSDCERRVEVTLSHITLTHGAQPGSTTKRAVITRIKEIK